MEFLGVESQLKHLQKVPKAVLFSFMRHAIHYLQQNSSVLDYSFFHTQGKMLNMSLSLNQFTQCCEAFLYILRWLIKNNPDNEGKFTLLNILVTHSSLGDDLVEELNDLFTAVFQQTHVEDAKIGLQLIDVDWRAGVAVSTDTGSSLNQPYITLNLTLANPQTGEVTNKVVVLLQTEYEELLKESRKINTILNTL